MDCPAKTDPIVSDGHNQNPNSLCADLTTNNDLGRIANARLQREHRLSDPPVSGNEEATPQPPSEDGYTPHRKAEMVGTVGSQEKSGVSGTEKMESNMPVSSNAAPSRRMPGDYWRRPAAKMLKVLRTYSKFIGPGFMIAVVSTHLHPPRYTRHPYSLTDTGLH
jgi:metal iron transporter